MFDGFRNSGVIMLRKKNRTWPPLKRGGMFEGTWAVHRWSLEITTLLIKVRTKGREREGKCVGLVGG